MSWLILEVGIRIERGLVGFRDRGSLQRSALYTQNSRGKFEAVVVSALANIMVDVNKMCTDLILFSMDEFGFVRLPRHLCTGSSIMPQKLNPDVLEVARAHYHTVVANEFLIRETIGNLISGYNRDLQMTKKPLMESFAIVESVLPIMKRVIETFEVDEEKCRWIGRTSSIRIPNSPVPGRILLPISVRYVNWNPPFAAIPLSGTGTEGILLQSCVVGNGILAHFGTLPDKRCHGSRLTKNQTLRSHGPAGQGQSARVWKAGRGIRVSYELPPVDGWSIGSSCDRRIGGMPKRRSKKPVS